MDFDKIRPYIYDLQSVKDASKKELFEVVSLFAGAGGSSTGYKLAGGKILAINEFVKAARDVYRRNYPETYIFPQDIRKLTGAQILEKIGKKKGELDILDGSPPCSGFSVAGKREKGWGIEKSYSDTKQIVDDLFFEYARIIKEVQPKVFIAENVKGMIMGAPKKLLGSEQLDMFGAHEDTIYYRLLDAGYNVRFKVLRASDYGVPQDRDRVIFIGVRKDIDKVITYPKIDTLHLVRHSVHDAIHDLKPDFYNPLSPAVAKVYPHLYYGECTYNYGQRVGEKMGGTQRSKAFKNKPSRTATTTPEIFHYEEPRTLAINELTRICAFPQDYYLGESFNKKWERLGRAVPPLMMKAIAEHVYETILK